MYYIVLQILCLTGLLLCISAHVFLNRLYKVDYSSEDDAPTPEDEMVFKISYAICCFRCVFQSLQIQISLI